MAQYTSATQTRIETTFSNMLRMDRNQDERYCFVRLYGLVTWGLFPRRDHVARKRATAEFFHRLADYADEQARQAGAE